ncbi:MAG: RHS repeat-associated core domain-containing protein, partial [Armatimonadetes bacterium]|nr:RHS repeat-associated core domain-containing protein [Armatimonadota bacterium]
TTTSTQYAGGAPVTETQGSTFTAAYTIGNDLLRRNGEYPAFDGLGSARAETNSSGTATATQDFDAFGNTIASSGSTSSPYNFAGDWAYQSDGDAGLQHVGARYYDPQVGRFASRDSMLDQIPYAYCGGEPNDFVDPSGRKATDWTANFQGAFEAGTTFITGGWGASVGATIGGRIWFPGRPLWRPLNPKAGPRPPAADDPGPEIGVGTEVGIGEGGEVIGGVVGGAEEGAEVGVFLGPEGLLIGGAIGAGVGLIAAAAVWDWTH